MRIVVVLGAGASLAHGQYFRPQNRQWSLPPLDYTFFEKIDQLDAVDAPRALRRYAARLPTGSPFGPAGHSSRMEQFFREIFYDFLEEGDANAAVRDAYLQLVDVYAGVIRETTNWMLEDGYRGGPVGRLLASAADVAERIDVVTFNHDLIIENEIARRARLSKRWCLERGYGTFSEGRSMLQSAAPMFPRHRSECDHDRGITIHKLHGSLNWIIRIRGRRPTHATLTGRASDYEVKVSRRRAVPGALRLRSRGKSGKRQTAYTWPVIVPPVYAKQPLIRAFMPSVWGDARTALENADRVLFFGYSMPAIDIEAEKLFERAIAQNRQLPWVGLVDPAATTVYRYASVLRNVALRSFPALDDFLQSDACWDA